MHIHAIQNNGALAQAALDAAQRAEARQRAEETRRKLTEIASQLASEDCIVTLGGQHEGGSRQQEGNEKKDKDAEAGQNEKSVEPQLSDWA